MLKGLFIWEARRDIFRDGTFAGTGRLTGRDVKRDLAMYVYIS